MESDTETVAKRARVGPRTQMHMTIEKSVWIRSSSTSVLRVSIIVLDNISKIWIELIMLLNDNGIEKFYRLPCFRKIDIFRSLVRIFRKNRTFKKIFAGGAPALQVIRAGTRLKVHP